jgi:4-diphosphocytidyl-2-C-methyl-D-erythritol kinase
MISHRKLYACAKINLTLHVLKKGLDNYHQIRSLVVFVDLYDELHIKRADELTVKFSNNFDEQISLKNNTLIKVHTYLKSIFPKINNYSINVIKNIPIAAGLGGGSADAAAFLRYILEDNNIDSNQIDFKKISYAVGADIPVCFYNRPSFIAGIGELLTETSFNERFYLVLVNPKISISTKDIYKKYNEKSTRENLINVNLSLIDTIMNGKNDLEDIVISDFHIIKEIIQSINKTKGCMIARMSGSGPTCYGIYKDEYDARFNEAELKKQYPQYWIKMFNVLA